MIVFVKISKLFIRDLIDNLKDRKSLVIWNNVGFKQRNKLS